MQSIQSSTGESLQEKMVRRNAYLLRKYHNGSPPISEDDQPTSSRPSVPQQDQRRCERLRQVPLPFRSPTSEEKVSNYLSRLVDPPMKYGRFPNHQQPAAINQQEEHIRHVSSRNQQIENDRNSDDNMETCVMTIVIND